MSKDTQFGIQSVCGGVMEHNTGSAGWDPTEAGRIKGVNLFISWQALPQRGPLLCMGVSSFCSVSKDMTWTRTG